jgi:hypothetical protein
LLGNEGLLADPTRIYIQIKNILTKYTRKGTQNIKHPIYIIYTLRLSNNYHYSRMSVPTKHTIVGILSAQERFAQNIDLSQPEKAVASYQEFMH